MIMFNIRLIPWIIVLLEKVVVPKLVKKLLYMCKNHEDYRDHSAQFGTSSVQYTPSHPVLLDGRGGGCIGFPKTKVPHHNFGRRQVGDTNKCSY